MTQPVPAVFQGPAVIPRAELLKILAAAAFLETVWSTDPRPVLGLTGGPQAWMVINITSVVAVAVDDMRMTYNPTTDRNDEHLSGYRILSVQCRVSSLDPDFYPYDALERLRWGTGTTVFQDALRAANLAYVDSSGITLYESRTGGKPAAGAAKVADRILMNGVMDLRFGWTAQGAVPNDPGDYVATINGGPEPGTPIHGTVDGKPV